MKNFFRYMSVLFVVAISPRIGKAQTFLNGSFENNTALTCTYNMTNNAFNLTMIYIRGLWGNPSGLDIFFDDSCFQDFGYAEEGDFFISLETDNFPSQVTGISLKLSDTLFIGNQYSFSYYNKIYVGSFGGDTIEIGLSSTDTSFGYLIYTSSLPDTGWRKDTVTFIAPIDGSYITARAKAGFPFHGTFIDNFVFDTTSVSINKLQKENSGIIIFPNPSKNVFNFKLNEKDVVEKIEVHDFLGMEVLSSTKKEIDLSNFSDGIYLYKLITQKGKIYVGKLLKQSF